MKKLITVATGEVKLGSQGDILRSSGIGSCVAVVILDSSKMVGGIAHIMLPGYSAGGQPGGSNKYAGNAIDSLVDGLKNMGADEANTEAFMVGGGNVLKKPDDTICRDNLASVSACLANKGVVIRGRSVGGTVNRTVHLDLSKGFVTYTEDNSGQMILWERPGE